MKKSKKPSVVPAVPEEHKELKRQLLARYGSAKNIAKATGRSIQTISGWGRTHPIPDPWPEYLRGWMTGAMPPLKSVDEPWETDEWRQAHAPQKAQEQIARLWGRSFGHGKEWAALVTTLDMVEPWKSKDWKELYDHLNPPPTDRHHK